MSFTSKCPKCQEQVTVPAGLEPEAVVRCPVCAVEYPLSEALALAPPALIIVSRPAAASLPTVEEVAAEDMPLVEAPEVVDEEVHFRLAGESEQLAEPSEPAAAEEEVDFVALTGQAKPEGAAPPAMPGEAPAPRRRRRPREPHPIRMGIGMLISGALAIAVGYYLANFFGGSQYDIWHIYLPGVKHTYKYRGHAETAQAKDDKKAETNGKLEANAGKAPTQPAPPPTPPVAPKPQPESAAKPQAKTKPQPAPETTDTEIETPEPAMTDPSLPADPGITPIAPPELKAEPKPVAAESKPEPKAAKPASESKPVPESKPESQPAPPATYIGPHQPPSFEAAELDKALAAVVAAKPTALVNAEVYEKIRRLAEVVTFARSTVDNPHDAAQKKLVRDMIEQIGADAGGADKVSELTRAWLVGDKQASGGILLIGTVTNAKSKDGLSGAAVRMGGTDLIVVVHTQPLGVQEGDVVAVLGSVIDQPSKNLEGYHGTQSRVVWSGMIVKLPPAKK
ncbi:MAG: hypothetical protein ABSG68_17245 [Thermoguttaceae bacterium]|jgi:hypothetical protein